MTDPAPRAELDTRFSGPEATPPDWADVLAVIERAEIFWLSTVRPDGRPHVTPLPAMWLDDGLHFCTGPREQKAVNLARNPQCALTTGTDRFRTGLDVIAEGRAERVTDQAVLQRLADMWLDKLDWRFEVVEGGFRDPDAPGTDGQGGAPVDDALVFRLAPAKVLAFGRGETYSQTRYRFG
jgi:general stress protein 26